MLFLLHSSLLSVYTQEELGLYADKGSELGLGSLLKMEQRLIKVGFDS